MEESENHVYCRDIINPNSSFCRLGQFIDDGHCVPLAARITCHFVFRFDGGIRWRNLTIMFSKLENMDLQLEIKLAARSQYRTGTRLTDSARRDHTCLRLGRP